MADNVIKLLLDTGMSAPEAEKVAAAIDRMGTAAKKTADTYEVLDTVINKSVGIIGTYDVLERKVTEAIVVHKTALDHLNIELERNVALNHVVTAEAGNVGLAMTRMMGSGGRGGSGQGILGASYAIQDFTSVLGDQGFGRALSSVQNNIPMLVTALGAGMGLAGAVSIVSVGVGLLISNWDKISSLWGEGQTAEEAKRMKELAKETDAAREAAEKLAKTLTPERREGQKELTRAVEAFGGQAVVKELQSALVRYQGSFGAEVDRDQAMKLLQGLQQGKLQSQQLLGDLDVRGPIGQVLRGGKTPQEEQQVMAKALERDAAAADQARKEQKEQAEKDAKEAERKRNQELDDRQKERENNEKMERDREKREKKEDKERDKLPMPSAAQLRRGDEELWQQEAANIEARVMQQGESTPAQRQRLGRLREKLGDKMPQFEQVQMMQGMVQQGIVSNQATFQQRLAMANRQIEQLRKMAGAQENNPMPSGLPR